MDVEVLSLDFGYATSTGAEWVFRDFNLKVKSGSMHSIVSVAFDAYDDRGRDWQTLEQGAS
jgi:hypothetical protein